MIKNINKRLVAGTLFMLVFAVSCRVKPEPTPSPSPTPTSNVQTIITDDGVEVEYVTSGEAVEKNYDDVFSLTEDEKALYEKYIETGDLNIFKDVSQISIAKIYFQCGLDMNWEREYDLYAKQSMPITKEEYGELVLEEPLADGERLYKIDEMLCYADQGKFVQTDEDHGYVEFTDRSKMDFKFYMIQEDGIWLVRVNPTRPDVMLNIEED